MKIANGKWSKRTAFVGLLAVVALGVAGFLIFSLAAGGRVAGFTHVDPGNVGLVINTYRGEVEDNLFPAGTHWQSQWERVIEIPTMQKVISLTSSDKDASGAEVDRSVSVNTPTNILKVDVSVNYQIQADRAKDLYRTYRDQFEHLTDFENIQIVPAVKEALNNGIGDEDTATALTTAGKQQAEEKALKSLNNEWAPRGIVFTNFMIRAVSPDDDTKRLLASTIGALQNIQNAKMELRQQKIDNATKIQMAEADAKVNRLKNSSLTDLYVQDQMLNQVHKVAMPSDQLMGLLKAK